MTVILSKILFLKPNLILIEKNQIKHGKRFHSVNTESETVGKT